MQSVLTLACHGTGTQNWLLSKSCIISQYWHRLKMAQLSTMNSQNWQALWVPPPPSRVPSPTCVPQMPIDLFFPVGTCFTKKKRLSSKRCHSFKAWVNESCFGKTLKNNILGEFPMKIETEISLLISYSFAIFIE